MAGGFQSPITINEAMQKIRKREYLLLAFQREYVWKPEQIEKLFDSLMRGYPINSMLFWKINGETKSKWKFYDFLQYFRPPHHTHNEFFETKGLNVFEAILDGQQRLTSLYLALFGHYDIGKNYTQWKNKNEEKFFKKCHFYFNLNSSRENNEELDIVFEFRWCDKDLTQEKIVFCDSDKKWFKIGEFYNEKYGNEKERNLSVRRISREFNLSESEETNLSLLYNKIFEDKTINFYSEDDENPDKAVNIFIRINSGGKPLDYSDILFSIAVANWKNRDAKGEINNLVDNINNLGFNIKKDLILKGFLFIFHDNIQFQINSFDKGFVEFIEEKWESIRDCFVEIFKLLRNFGLEAKTLPSVNSVLPILYFTYHNNLTGQIVDSVTQKQNRELIKKWLMRVVILKPLGGSGDTVLTNMRKAFIKDFKQNDKKYFDETLELFPLKQIEREAKYSQTIDDEYLEDNIIYSRKNSAEAFSVLSLFQI